MLDILLAPAVSVSLQRFSLALLLVVFSSNLAAQDSPWDWRLSPLYYLSVNLSGELADGSGEPPIDTGEFDIEFEGAFTASFEGVYKDRWGFVTDFIWIDLTTDHPRTDAELRVQYLQAEADGYYRMSFSRQTLDWLVGARYYDAEFKLEPTRIAVNKDWVDPIVGARWTRLLAKQWTLRLRADVGGFGVGSDLAWQAAAILDWAPWKLVSVTGGVRGWGVDYSSGNGSDSAKIDITVSGPFLGASFRW